MCAPLLELDEIGHADNAGLLHDGTEIVRTDKRAGTFQIVGCEEGDDVVAIGGAPQQVQFAQAGLITRAAMGVVSAFPSVEVLDFCYE